MFYVDVWYTRLAAMAKLADAHGSGPCGSDSMEVQVLLAARITGAAVSSALPVSRLPNGAADESSCLEQSAAEQSKSDRSATSPSSRSLDAEQRL